MPSSSKSTVNPDLKPMNIFYVWYAELCRRSHTNPLAIVKPPKPKNDTVLDFTADRIKPEEWRPILNAIRLDTSLHVIGIRSRVAGCKFLYDMNTLDRVRSMKRRSASLWTDYILRSLMGSLSSCIKNSQVLSSLELDGLPLSAEYLDSLLQSLRNNRTIKMLSFKRCPINDGGCQKLCVHLRFMPNVEVLNLSSCGLSSISGQHIARVIKHQQIHRYCESWHNSLRYEDPENGSMAGIKRITLNNNPYFGDEGLAYILDELDDDLWIKAIDMQKCNITNNMSRRLIDIVEYSRSLEVADFRNNENLGLATVEKILEVLEKKQQFGIDPEYQWCLTSTTLYDYSSFEASRSNISGVSTQLQKSRSAPLRQLDSASRCSTKPVLRRTKTVALIDRKPKCNATSVDQNMKHVEAAKKQLANLNAKLQEEISKRKLTEKTNVELQQKLNEIRHLGDRAKTTEEGNVQNKVTKVIHLIEDFQLNDKKCSYPQHKNKKEINEKTIKVSNAQSSKKAYIPKAIKEYQNVIPKKESTSFKKPVIENKLYAQNMFEEFLRNDKNVEEDEGEESDFCLDNVLSYYYDSDVEGDSAKSPNVQLFKPVKSESPLSGSDVSLERFLHEMNINDDNLPSETSNQSQNAKNLFRKCIVKVS